MDKKYHMVLLASERSERDTIRGNKWKSEIYIIYVYVIARVGVKFVPEISRLTVLFKD